MPIPVIQESLRRELPSGALIEFEQSAAGSLGPDGSVRMKDFRAYYWTSQPLCGVCEGSGRRPSGSHRRKDLTIRCSHCKGTGRTQRQRMTSVSTILDSILPKDGLVHWAEARGIEGAILAVQQGKLDLMCTPEQAVAELRRLRLGAEAARDKAAGRGLDIHGLLGDYMTTGSLPSSDRVQAEDMGYHRALCRFLAEEEPTPEQVEELVCEPNERYAGRSDLVANHKNLRVRYEYKTNERCQIFPSAHCQIGLYERAAIYCEDEPCDILKIIGLGANGDWRSMPIVATEKTLDAALSWYRDLRSINSICAVANRRASL